MDGRGVTDVRPIWSRAGCLPRVHGSALFTRGETQALAVTTLGEPHLEGCTSCPDLLRAFTSALFTRFVITVVGRNPTLRIRCPLAHCTLLLHSPGVSGT